MEIMENKRGFGAIMRSGRWSACGYGLLAAFGLGVNLVWCTLMGHTIGFLSSATGIEELVNPRLFFLSGILAVSLAYVVAPRLLKRADGMLRFILPLLAAFGTTCFGMAYHQSFFAPAVLAVVGLFVAGICYFWLVARYMLMLGRTRGFVFTVACIAVGLVLKLPILMLLSAFVEPEMQVAIAIIAPVVSAAVFEACCTLAKRNASTLNEGVASLGGESSLGVSAVQRETMEGSQAELSSCGMIPRRTVFGIPIPAHDAPKPAKADRRAAFILIATAAVVLAVIRSVSYLGMWGNTNANISDVWPWFTGLVVPALAVAAFAYGALARMADYSLSLRFQPALLLVFAGLFVVAIQVNPNGASLPFLTDVIQIDELCAHLLFWAVVVAVLDVLDTPSYRVMGFAGAVYGVASIAWVLLLSRAAIVDTLLLMLLTYALVVVALYATWAYARKKDATASAGGPVAAGSSRGDSPSVQEEAAGADPSAETPLSHTVSTTCLEMAERYGLSPRETEVFILLAQGRTRSFIQEELVLSGSTVKTHVSHIYAKLNVHDRQEMMDLIWN